MRHHTTSSPQFPAADRPWSVESYGIESVADGDRHGRPIDLMWIWFAANIGVVGIIYGAILTGLGLDLWQGLAAAILGTSLSFALVGILGVAGKWSGVPMLGLSRIPFGRLGNFPPALVSWLSLLGWETVTVVVTAYAALALVGTVLHVQPAKIWLLPAMILVVSTVLVLSRLGHATIVVVQRLVAWTFGLLTLAVLPWLVLKTHWSALLAQRPGSWLALLGGVAIVAASGGISWVNVSADYSRYLPRRERGRAIVGWTTLGSTIPLAMLIVVGILLTTSVNGLGSATDPIGAIGAALPSWLSVPYLLAAIGGLMAQLLMGLYSSGLNLLALGANIRRSRTVLIDAAVVTLAGSYILFAREGFLAIFLSFISLLACGISTWAAIFVVDMALRRGYGPADLRATGLMESPVEADESAGSVRLPAVVSWLAGSAIGLLCTASPLFTGPLAVGIFAQSSLGYLLGALVSAGLYGFLGRGLRSLRPQPARIG